MSDEQKKDELFSSIRNDNNSHDIKANSSNINANNSGDIPKFNPNPEEQKRYTGQSTAQPLRQPTQQLHGQPNQPGFNQQMQGQPAPNQPGHRPFGQPNQPGFNQHLQGQAPYQQGPQGQPIYGQPPYPNQYQAGVNGPQQPYQQQFFNPNQNPNSFQGQYQGQYAPPAYTGRKTNTKSIVSLILGILSIMIPYIGVLIGIAAIILASISLKEIKKRDEDGRGLSIAGLITGIIGTILYAIIIFIIVIVFILAESSYYY